MASNYAIASVASVGFGIAGAAQSDAARKKNGEFKTRPPNKTMIIPEVNATGIIMNKTLLILLVVMNVMRGSIERASR